MSVFTLLSRLVPSSDGDPVTSSVHSSRKLWQALLSFTGPNLRLEDVEYCFETSLLEVLLCLHRSGHHESRARLEELIDGFVGNSLGPLSTATKLSVLYVLLQLFRPAFECSSSQKLTLFNFDYHLLSKLKQPSPEPPSTSALDVFPFQSTSLPACNLISAIPKDLLQPIRRRKALLPLGKAPNAFSKPKRPKSSCAFSTLQADCYRNPQCNSVLPLSSSNTSCGVLAVPVLLHNASELTFKQLYDRSYVYSSRTAHCTGEEYVSARTVCCTLRCTLTYLFVVG